MQLRSTCILLLLMCMNPVFSQQQDHYFEVDPPLDLFSIRPVYELVRDLDPNGKVLHSDDMTLLQLRVDPTISNDALRQALTQRGIPLREGTSAIPANEPILTTLDGKPLYIATDDQAGDRQRYETAVKAWNEAHPEDPMPLPLRSSTDQ